MTNAAPMLGGSALDPGNDVRKHQKRGTDQRDTESGGNFSDHAR
jgi:hypothetical protein